MQNIKHKEKLPSVRVVRVGVRVELLRQRVVTRRTSSRNVTRRVRRRLVLDVQVPAPFIARVVPEKGIDASLAEVTLAEFSICAANRGVG